MVGEKGRVGRRCPFRAGGRRPPLGGLSQLGGGTSRVGSSCREVSGRSAGTPATPLYGTSGGQSGSNASNLELKPTRFYNRWCVLRYLLFAPPSRSNTLVRLAELG